MGMIFVTLIRTIVRGVSRVQITFRHFVGFFFASMVLIRTISGRNLLWNKCFRLHIEPQGMEYYISVCSL